MKILIVGESINSILLAKYINIQNPSDDIYVTQKESEHCDFCTFVNIRESDIGGLASFVKYNQIEFTIVLSEIAIINGISEEFQKEGFLIFAPSSQSSRITFFNSIAKKIMYKLKIPTQRFGIFDRENLAVEYVRNAKFPVLIQNDFMLLERINEKYNSFSSAKTGIQKLFETGNEKIVIENFLDEPDIFLYFISDGYNAFPIADIEKYNGEDYSSFVSSSEKISDEIIMRILRNVVYPLLDDISKFSQPYLGILGMKLKVRKNQFYVSEFFNAFQGFDFQIFLSLMGENILALLYDAVSGRLSENRNHVEKINGYSFSVSVNKKYVKNTDEDFDNIFISENDERRAYSVVKPTLNSAKSELFSCLESVVDDKMLSKIKTEDEKKELRI